MPLAALIARTPARSPAIANYAVMGGASPLLPETQAQARGAAGGAGGTPAGRRGPRVRRHALLAAVHRRDRRARWRPSRRTRSCCCRSIRSTRPPPRRRRWRPGARPTRARAQPRRSAATPTATGWSRPTPTLIREAWEAAGPAAKVRLLFSAHGLPQRIVDGGDPYHWQVEAHLRGGRGAAGRGLGLADLLPEPGRAAEMARALDAEAIERGGGGGPGRARSIRSPSSPSTSRPWSSSTATTPSWRGRLGCTALSAGAGAGRRAGVHRRPGGRPWSRRWPGQPASRPRRRALPGGPAAAARCEPAEERRHDCYNLLRGLHIIAVIAWMAGLLYLPRLFAYHTAPTPGSEMDETFQIMEAEALPDHHEPGDDRGLRAWAWP